LGTKYYYRLKKLKEDKIKTINFINYSNKININKRIEDKIQRKTKLNNCIEKLKGQA